MGLEVSAARDRLLLSFEGFELSREAAESIARRAAGVTLYRHLNVRSAAQVRELTSALQAAAARLGLPPLLIAADHETGQLHAMGDDATPFAGAMALGAVSDDALAERVGAAIGTELRAMGVNLVFAPDCDLATNPGNPVVGIRSFGDDPVAVGRLAAASVRGLQSVGVAATVKHLPGHGEPGADSHVGLPVIEATRHELLARELVPFRAAIAAGARVAMAGHLGVPALTGRRDLPATLAREVVTDLLRGELGFGGLAVTDALDMGGVQGAEGPDLRGALSAGTDLLLCGPDAGARARIEAGLGRALETIDPAEAAASRRRLDELRRWLAGFDQPPLAVVGCDEHRAVAGELARRSITVLRDRGALRGRIVPPDVRILVVEPAPRNLTPADTTSLLPAGGLAAAIRERHSGSVEGHVVAGPVLGSDEIVRLSERGAAADLVILGTVDAPADPSTAELARALVASGRPVIAVALRGPWDADAYPEIGTVVVSYGIQPPSVAAVADVIVAGERASGCSPVRLTAEV